ncbi:hypothetical protein [Palleronia sp. LCG004]|uniref:head-tail connector protein n=1 Tax=Palleronia sp. LCG004 TaxID=3079304 RepID=UPI00294227E3|nr:hypothetical protein [Palleronia sp. LCG004]WOI55014.1 hypothetical protein RVY76_08025 [Palleronia sp. LCG004]
MYLTEPTRIADADLPMEQFRDHLHLGTGFSDDDAQNLILIRTLRSAIAQVEMLCGKALLARDFICIAHAWSDLSRTVLPRAPVVRLDALTIVDADATHHLIKPDRYGIERDIHRPELVARGFALPQIPVGGHAEIRFHAGYGTGWDEIPADLSLATMMLAASHYEDRTALGSISPGVQSMLAPYRPRRLLGGF